MENDGREPQKCIRLPATNGPRPFRCEICQRSFREIATLRKHEQLHRADRPYICTTCGKSFLWSSNLKVHERVHTGERPYKCKICHRCFTQSNDLRRHERNVHMRGKLYSYKTPQPKQPAAGHMHMAAYQAFAIQQRALLQHALTYESIMQSAAVTQSRYHHHHESAGMLPAIPMSKSADLTVSTSSQSHSAQPPPTTPTQGVADSPHKMEPVKVSPPTTPVDSQYPGSENGSISDTSKQEERYLQSPGHSRYSPPSGSTSSVIHSPPSLTSSLIPQQNGHALSEESPDLNGDGQMPEGYAKYYNDDEQSSINDLPRVNSHSSIYPHIPNSCDSVIDLSVNKSISSVDSEDGEWKRVNSSLMSKSPDSGSEYDVGKRDVTTTSQSPTADSGIHHCPHCNIFFHDFTMYHLHQSLHSPMDDDPFRCPSCAKACQDRIEFMFHIVWHVKYPHTIPNYHTFKESYLGSDHGSAD